MSAKEREKGERERENEERECEYVCVRKTFSKGSDFLIRNFCVPFFVLTTTFTSSSSSPSLPPTTGEREGEREREGGRERERLLWDWDWSKSSKDSDDVIPSSELEKKGEREHGLCMCIHTYIYMCVRACVSEI